MVPTMIATTYEPKVFLSTTGGGASSSVFYNCTNTPVKHASTFDRCNTGDTIDAVAGSSLIINDSWNRHRNEATSGSNSHSTITHMYNTPSLCYNPCLSAFRTSESVFSSPSASPSHDFENSIHSEMCSSLPEACSFDYMVSPRDLTNASSTELDDYSKFKSDTRNNIDQTEATINCKKFASNQTSVIKETIQQLSDFEMLSLNSSHNVVRRNSQTVSDRSKDVVIRSLSDPQGISNAPNTVSNNTPNGRIFLHLEDTVMRNDTTNKKQHLCPQCLQDFKRPDILSRHIRTHTGEKPFQCTICLRSFSRTDHLRTHKRTHTDEKPYSCSVCSYSARRRDVLTRHMSSIHSVRTENQSRKKTRKFSLNTASDNGNVTSTTTIAYDIAGDNVVEVEELIDVCT